jgi:hypothetical protein
MNTPVVGPPVTPVRSKLDVGVKLRIGAYVTLFCVVPTLEVASWAL